jgi:hypothetical protein
MTITFLEEAAMFATKLYYKDQTKSDQDDTGAMPKRR